MLRSVLPKTMQADAQPPAFDLGLRAVNVEAQRKQYQQAAVAFTRLEWSMSWDASLTMLLSQEAGRVAFTSWLQREAPEDLAQLELFTSGSQLADVPASEAGPRAVEQRTNLED